MEVRPLDRIIDWAPIATGAYKTQKQQAIYLTLAANSVLNDETGAKYWDAERRPIAGQYLHVFSGRQKYIARRLGQETASTTR